MTDRDKMLDKIRALLSKTTENGCTQEEELAQLADGLLRCALGGQDDDKQNHCATRHLRPRG
jgi:hypothetical protein